MARRHGNDSDSKQSPISRRSFLGSAAAAAAAGVVGAGSATAAEYDTITVSAGSTRTISVGSGETFENKLIDITASGASVSIHAKANDWTIRNVGVKGQQSSDVTMFSPAVPDSGSSARVENVYMGGGGSSGGGVGVWVDATGSDAHRGTLVFDNFHVAGFADNGLYASGPGTKLGPDAGGPVHILNSFAHNNNISNFRIGTNGSKIVNSVALVDGNVTPHANGINGRGIWVREHAQNMLIEDSVSAIRHSDGGFAVGAYYGDEQCTVRNSTVEGPIAYDSAFTLENVSRSAPSGISLPDGVPMSAEEAAGGTSSGGSTGGSGGSDGSSGGSTEGVPGDPTTTRSMTITGPSGTDSASYVFEVQPSQDGTAGVVKTGEPGAGADGDDVVTELDNGNYRVEGGAALGGTDTFDVTGYFQSFESPSGDTFGVEVDGQSVPQDQLVEAPPSDSQTLPKYVIVDGKNNNAWSRYEFVVDGTVEKTDEWGSVNDHDEINGSTVSGSVYGGSDAYRYSGSVTEFKARGPADIRFGSDE
jgi:hypothetical protein